MHQAESESSPAAVAPRAGRILAFDLGTVHTGVAVCDENHISIRRLQALTRTNWKKFVHNIQDLCRHLDARAVVIGLPLNMDGSQGAGSRRCAPRRTQSGIIATTSDLSSR
jgi:putative Holliday junction resolvase